MERDMGLVEEIRPDVLDLIAKGKHEMKYVIYAICAVALIAAGCASNANQKISSPLLGTVKNEYTIYNIHLENLEDFDRTTNILKRVMFSAPSTNSQEKARKTVMASLGRGNELFAIDNQVLVGRDIGNATSNAVNASASIPLNF